MKLTVVGCAGSYPSAASAASCYLLEHDGARIVLDLGNGSLGPLQEYVDLVDESALSAVILSHCHVDHCADVASLFVVRNYAPAPATTPLLLIGPSDTADRISAIYGMTDPEQLSTQFDVRLLGAEPIVVGPFTVTCARAAHPVEAFSIRVSAGGRSLTYSGDTGPTPALAELAHGTDVALFEASYVGSDNPVDLHMTGADAGRAATAAGAGLLLLTHHAAWNDQGVVLAEATGTFDGPIEHARPGMTISL